MMQTFLPYPNFTKSAAVLDRQRLGKQRSECLQILRALSDSSYGWQNHPAVKMWRGCERALAAYGLVVCAEWIDRGYKDTCMEKIMAFVDHLAECVMPDWLGKEEFHLAHRRILLAKSPEHYRQFWPGLEPAEMVNGKWPYVWPKIESE